MSFPRENRHAFSERHGVIEVANMMDPTATQTSSCDRFLPISANGIHITYVPCYSNNAATGERSRGSSSGIDRRSRTIQYRPTYEYLYKCSFSAGERVRRDAAHIKMLAVHPDYQKRGYGRQLLGLACRQVRIYLCHEVEAFFSTCLPSPLAPRTN